MIYFLFEIVVFPFLVVIALIARFVRKPIDIGLGPHPLINNIYHKKALELQGYTTETFVSETYFITQEFDYIAFEKLEKYTNFLIIKRVYRLRFVWLFVRSIFRYKCLYIYFNGGPFGLSNAYWRIEPWLYQLAGIKIVVMPYGGDVHDMMKCPDLFFRHTMGQDYPKFHLTRKHVSGQVELWTKHADHVISGCDWVHYMHYWDTLMLAHFSIDLQRWKPEPMKRIYGAPLKVLHAPNHRQIKGSAAFIKAIEELREEGEPIELVLIEQQPNHVVKQKIAECDVVADQLVIGWYAMFALEAMAMEKPAICYLDPELVKLYQRAGLVEPKEIPLLNATQETVKELLKELVKKRDQLEELGKQSRAYVSKHHSTESVGVVFDRINRSIQLNPSQTKEYKEYNDGNMSRHRRNRSPGNPLTSSAHQEAVQGTRVNLRGEPPTEATAGRIDSSRSELAGLAEQATRKD